jgi:hypothetical protein
MLNHYHLEQENQGPGIVAHAYNLRYSGGTGRRIAVQVQPRQKHEILYEK